MEIAMVQSLPIGNAVDLNVNVEEDISWLRVLRKPGLRNAVTFSGSTDISATRVVDIAVTPQRFWHLLPSIIDYQNLNNNSSYSYVAFGYNSITAQWSSSTIIDVTVNPTAELDGPDPLDFLVSRIQQGIAAEVAAQRLHPKSGRIPVLTAPPQTANTPMPCVTVHLDIDQSSERYLGERLGQDLYINPGDNPDDVSGDIHHWIDGEGWHSRWTCTITGWSLNPDERNSLRKAIKRTVMGNLPIFDQEGMVQVDLSIRDTEDLEGFNVPMYMTVQTLNCLAPAHLTGQYPAIDQTVIELRETGGISLI